LEAIEPVLARYRGRSNLIGSTRQPLTAAAAEACRNARDAVENDPVCAYLSSEKRREADVLFKAFMLARDLQTCEALLRGEKVPRSRLDPVWAKAYGL
jgi:hypothetical protein